MRENQSFSIEVICIFGFWLAFHLQEDVITQYTPNYLQSGSDRESFIKYHGVE